MVTEHIVKSYDEELTQLGNLIAELGGLAEVQLAESVDALVKRDVEKAERVVEGDKRLDELEREIDELGVEVIARRQPMAGDLRSIISALKTASILERIGDYAKNIAKRAIALAQTPPIGPMQSISRMAERTQAQVKIALDAYIHSDADLAEDVRISDHEVDSMHTSLFREILTYMLEDPRNISACTQLLFVAKNLERIGDHTTNIAENIIYLVTGVMPPDDRPKQDAAHYTIVQPESVETAAGDEEK